MSHLPEVEFLLEVVVALAAGLGFFVLAATGSVLCVEFFFYDPHVISSFNSSVLCGLRSNTNISFSFPL